ncbi:DUF779 domain-containing protein [Gemmatimonas sp.]|jgi:uncharacterized protein (DUF779 family)|uniref:DUF779 domain-containing protein n=1 Tax=Gemmatimonas sp. TaxID=1962908 RepID=UPI002621D019|nr:DUF779 domain-containing protein [Gemmatimonas sp.]
MLATPVARATVTPAAAALLHKLQALHGPLVFHQSGGCCDGSAPMCDPRGELRIGFRDVYLGTIADTPFYIGGEQYEYWKHTLLIIDGVRGRGSGFSVDAPEGGRFLTWSRWYRDAEWERLQAPGEAPRGEQSVV